MACLCRQVGGRGTSTGTRTRYKHRYKYRYKHRYKYWYKYTSQCYLRHIESQATKLDMVNCMIDDNYNAQK